MYGEAYFPFSVHMNSYRCCVVNANMYEIASPKLKVRKMCNVGIRKLIGTWEHRSYSIWHTDERKHLDYLTTNLTLLITTSFQHSVYSPTKLTIRIDNRRTAATSTCVCIFNWSCEYKIQDLRYSVNIPILPLHNRKPPLPPSLIRTAALTLDIRFWMALALKLASRFPSPRVLFSRAC